MKNNEVQEMINNAEEAAETVEETIKEDGKIKKGLKVVWKVAKKAAPAIAAGVGGFVIGRLTKGAVEELPIPEEAVEAVTEAVENVTE